MSTENLQHFLSLEGRSGDDIIALLDLAASLKAELKSGAPERRLDGKVLAMIFEKPSLRTRVTFEAGMLQLGGSAIFLGPENIAIGKRETPADIAGNLSRWVDGIMARTFSHQTLLELAKHATIPVVNGLTDRNHPCQILADLLTAREQFGDLEGRHVVWIGDGNNVCHSWLTAASKLGMRFTAACPDGYHPDADVLATAQANAPEGNITVTHDVVGSARGADILYTDTWTSMGQEAEAGQRRETFAEYQVNETLVEEAGSQVRVMHCLPAHRGEEITSAVLDGPQSLVLEQAENRLHAQKAVLVTLLGQ